MTETLIKALHLFWQYPVITEKTFYQQNKHNVRYFGFPWATIIDKNYNLAIIAGLIKNHVKRNQVGYYTCCQHVYFKKLFDIWREIGIKVVYCPHKIKGEDEINGIKILPCPLYAVNIEDNRRNEQLYSLNLLEQDRPLLYTFVGAYQPHNYLTDIRARIYNLPGKDKKDVYIKNTGGWHFNNIVYSHKQNDNGDLNETATHKKNTYDYTKLLLNSRYTLAPSGSGPNSIRFWEALGAGSIPVLLADTLELPENKLWDSAIVRMKEDDVNKIDDILRAISPEEEENRRQKCLQLYNFYKNNYINYTSIKDKFIVHYCCASYDIGLYGGVARYDYQLKKAFPNRLFVRQKDPALQKLCKRYGNRLVIITDNHLACDIPNNIKTYLVHHGVAQTHAEREPGWSLYWKTLCCEGQKKMIFYREPKTTTILSISQFCTDEFTKYYRDRYTKFRNIKVLHSSELDETKKKGEWNNVPVILGNWKGINKGENIIPTLSHRMKNFKFRDLVITPVNKDIEDFNKRKQEIYLNSDIFLQLSLCEGYSYAGLDALLCGIPVVASDVGLFYKDLPQDCFVKLDWRRVSEIEYVKSKIEYAWNNKDVIGKKGRDWYLKNCKFSHWKAKMRHIIGKS